MSLRGVASAMAALLVALSLGCTGGPADQRGERGPGGTPSSEPTASPVGRPVTTIYSSETTGPGARVSVGDFLYTITDVKIVPKAGRKPARPRFHFLRVTYRMENRGTRDVEGDALRVAVREKSDIYRDGDRVGEWTRVRFIEASLQSTGGASSSHGIGTMTFRPGGGVRLTQVIEVSKRATDLALVLEPYGDRPYERGELRIR